MHNYGLLGSDAMHRVSDTASSSEMLAYVYKATYHIPEDHIFILPTAITSISYLQRKSWKNHPKKSGIKRHFEYMEFLHIMPIHGEQACQIRT